MRIDFLGFELSCCRALAAGESAGRGPERPKRASSEAGSSSSSSSSDLKKKLLDVFETIPARDFFLSPKIAGKRLVRKNWNKI